jgi:hypothetical protein
LSRRQTSSPANWTCARRLDITGDADMAPLEEMVDDEPADEDDALKEARA